jgi:hypothetical protein
VLDDKQAGKEYSKFLGVKKEKDRHIGFKVIDYLCYAALITLIIAINVEWNLLHDQSQHFTAFFIVVGIYGLSHTAEGLLDGKKRTVFLFGIPALLSIAFSFVFVFAG